MPLPISYSDALMLANLAERGDLSATGKLVRALLNNEVVRGGDVLPAQAGLGFTSGVGAVYKSGVARTGGIVRSSILLDLTGVGSSTTDLDIIGVGASPAHIGQINLARNGGLTLTGRMTCLEVPAGGVTDIDLYSATESTGVFDQLVTALTETALITSGGAWTLGLVRVFSGIPLIDQYLYLANGAAGTVGTYTAGKFLIEMEGYDA